ncbi:ABC transporter substrate-binding protein [bacterium]|nr:MAG: ABC transporter substrate-binding protein [bacterium]
MTRPFITIALAALAAFALVGCGNSGEATPKEGGTGTTATKKSGEQIRLAFVTNNSSDFWTFARKGTEKAEKEMPDVKVEFKIPDDASAAGQKRIVEDLIATGIDGVAISPNDPTNMAGDLDKWSESTLVVTQDSDAPTSKRALYVGTDNIAAGRQAGEEIKKAIPNGGKVAVFVGKIDVQNAKERLQGIEEALKGSNCTLLPTLTDEADRVRSKANVLETLTKTPDVACLVGLWSYNGPMIINAVKEVNKQGKVKIVCFDEEPDTLQAIEDGFIDATIVQQPYEFGYEAIKAMAAMKKGDTSGVPANKLKIIPTKVVSKATIEEFKKTVAELRGS